MKKLAVLSKFKGGKMKKISNKTWGIFIVLALLFSSFVSCAKPGGNSVEQCVGDENGKGNQDDSGEPEELNAEENKLVQALVEFLGKINNVPADMPENSFEGKINLIKSGNVLPLLVEIDSFGCYFVCGYYKCQDHEYEYQDYDCASKYTWVKYENANELRENYSGKDLIVAFQINRTSLTQNILTGDRESNTVTQFGIYRPDFVDGANANSADAFERTFVFLSKSNESEIYYTSLINDAYYSISCVYLDGEYFIPLKTYSIDASGERYDCDIAWDLGDYYEDMIEIMIVGKYSKIKDNGSISHYGLFEINDFVDVVFR